MLLSIKERAITAPSPWPQPAGKEVWTKDAVSNVLALLKGMSSLMLFLSMKADGPGHPERVRSANGEAEKLLVKLGYSEGEGA